MKISTTLIRRAGLVAGLVAASVLTGCVTSHIGIRPDVAVEVQKQVEWYGRVLVIVDPRKEPERYAKWVNVHCNTTIIKEAVQGQTDFCANPQRFKIVRAFPYLSPASLGLWLEGYLPIDAPIEVDGIVKASAVRHRSDWLTSFVPFSIAAAKQNPVCQWTGTGVALSAGIGGGGGVVCNGWDYRETFVWVNARHSIVNGLSGNVNGPPAPYVAPIDGPQQTGWAQRQKQVAPSLLGTGDPR